MQMVCWSICRSKMSQDSYTRYTGYLNKVELLISKVSDLEKTCIAWLKAEDDWKDFFSDLS